MTTAYNIMGLLGSIITSAAFIPQLYKVFSTKSAADISYRYVCMYITGLSCLEVYGLGESLWPIYAPGALELVGAIALLILKIRYDARPKPGTDLERCHGDPTGSCQNGQVGLLPAGSFHAYKEAKAPGHP